MCIFEKNLNSIDQKNYLCRIIFVNIFMKEQYACSNKTVSPGSSMINASELKQLL